MKFTKHHLGTVRPGRIPTAKRKSLPVCRTENQFPMAPSRWAGLVGLVLSFWSGKVCAPRKKKAKNSEINSPLPLLVARSMKKIEETKVIIYLFVFVQNRAFRLYLFCKNLLFPKPHHFCTLDPGPPDGVRVSRGFYEDRPGLEGMENAFALISAYGPTGSKKCGFIECIIIWK